MTVLVACFYFSSAQESEQPWNCFHFFGFTDHNLSCWPYVEAQLCCGPNYLIGHAYVLMAFGLWFMCLCLHVIRRPWVGV
jgi:hypothetical protein